MSTIIQIAISVTVIYFIFSILVYVAVEWFSGLIELRGVTLRKAILEAFNDNLNKDFGALIYSHPQVEYLKRTLDSLPAYIPSKNVAVSLIDLIGKNSNPPQYKVDEKTQTLSVIETNDSSPECPYKLYNAGLKKLNDSHFKTLLLSLSQQASNLETLTRNIEDWYNNYMDRVTGWYKKRIRKVVLIAAIIVTVAFNVDSIYIMRAVTVDPQLRSKLNSVADDILADSALNQLTEEARLGHNVIIDSLVKSSNGNRDSLIRDYMEKRQSQYKDLTQRMGGWDLPIGWKLKKEHSYLFIILGWFITVLALSAGAPFWFDLLKKLVNVRNAGLKPGSTLKKE